MYILNNYAHSLTFAHLSASELLYQTFVPKAPESDYRLGYTLTQTMTYADTYKKEETQKIQHNRCLNKIRQQF